MKVYLQKTIIKYPLLVVNISVLVFAMIFSKIVFADSLGWGDAMHLMSRLETPWEHMRTWYESQNGRLSQALLGGIVKGILRGSFATPESFPWWIFRGFWLFCAITAPINFMAIFASKNWRAYFFQLLFVLIIVWLIWSTSPIYYYTNAWFTAAEFLSYTSTVYLGSVFLLLWKQTQSEQYKWWQWLIFSAAYIFLSLLNEHMMASIPILVVGVALAGIVENEKSLKYIFQVTLVSILLTLIAMSIYLTTPGQIARNAIINAGAPDLSFEKIYSWYTNTLPYVYQYLSPVLFGRGPVKLLNVILLGHTGLVVILFFTAKGAAKKMKVVGLDLILRKQAEQDYVASVLSLMFMISYIATLSTVLVSNYWPGYSGIYPSILLTLGLVSAAVLYTNLLLRKLGSYYQFLNSSIYNIGLCILAVIAVILIFVFPNVNEIMSTNSQVKTNTKIRLSYYQEILKYHREMGESNFILKKCPYAVYNFGWSVEPPWGISAYLLWRGLPEVSVVIDSNPDYSNRSLDKEYRVIDCENF